MILGITAILGIVSAAGDVAWWVVFIPIALVMGVMGVALLIGWFYARKERRYERLNNISRPYLKFMNEMIQKEFESMQKCRPKPPMQ